MGDFVYYGDHSIDIKPDGADTWDNTWETWHIAPSVRPVVVPPTPKTEYVDVPGADGSLDYTNVLGKTRYQNRTGSWNFLIDNGYWDWPVLYTEFMEKYHGRNCQIILKDDPYYYYIGRLTLKNYNQAKDYSSFEIEYNLEPYKWPIESSRDRDWLWNELFGKPSYFGPIVLYDEFSLEKDGCIERNILNPDPSDEEAVGIYTTSWCDYEVYKYEKIPSFNFTDPWSVVLVKETAGTLNAGENPEVFTLKGGEVKLLRLNGTGVVKIDIGSGKRL